MSVDLNVMMREQARTNLQTQLDTAVQNGDIEQARKASDQLAQLAVQSAPKAPPYGDVEVRSELNKQDWFGVDPKKSAKALEFGKTMDPRKFSTAEAFAAAVIKAVDDEFKPAVAAAAGEENEDPEEGEDDTVPPKPAKRSDAPAPGETDPRSRAAGRSGPWSKLSDAPQDVRAEIKRQSDKFLPAAASKEIREAFNKRQLEAHYAAHQRKGKAK